MCITTVYTEFKKNKYKEMKKEIRKKVWEKCDYKCAYCGEPLEYSKMQIDHITPKFKGGENKIDNYNPSCRQCNFYKSTLDLESFRSKMSSIIDRIKKPFIVRLAIKYNIIHFKTFDGIFYFEKKLKTNKK